MRKNVPKYEVNNMKQIIPEKSSEKLAKFLKKNKKDKNKAN